MISSNSMHIATKLTETAGEIGRTPSAQAWFAGGERVGYDPRGRAIVRAQSAALNVFLRRPPQPGPPASGALLRRVQDDAEGSYVVQSL